MDKKVLQLITLLILDIHLFTYINNVDSFLKGVLVGWFNMFLIKSILEK